LLALLAALAVICLIVVPSLAGSANRSERVVCLNNLGQLGRAYQMWATDHDDYWPFLVGTNQGGIRTHPLGSNIYFQVAILSNELRTASVLACPSDVTTRRAVDFSAAPGGLLHPLLRNNAVSYFITHPWNGSESWALAGDRNLEGTMGTGGCPYFVSITRLGGALAAWRETVHMSSGNILYQSGVAEQTGDIQVQNLLRFRPEGGLADHHLVMRAP
jgi:hypothetical protein